MSEGANTAAINAEVLRLACEESARLKDLLEQEFSALRSQSLDEFERLQPLKNDIFAKLSGYVQVLDKSREGPNPEEILHAPLWEVFKARMAESRDAHLRNDILIRSKLEAINSTLRLLQNSGRAASVQLSDRLGRLGGPMRGRGYTDV